MLQFKSSTTLLFYMSFKRDVAVSKTCPLVEAHTGCTTSPILLLPSLTTAPMIRGETRSMVLAHSMHHFFGPPNWVCLYYPTYTLPLTFCLLHRLPYHLTYTLLYPALAFTFAFNFSVALIFGLACTSFTFTLPSPYLYPVIDRLMVRCIDR